MRIALIAHDARKHELVDWATWNRALLAGCELAATRTSGELVAAATGLRIRLLLSGPHGGDAQIGAMIARGELDLVVFLWDPLAAHAHEPDVRALLRLAVLHDIAIACNRRTADLIVTSRLLGTAAAA
jgi:methylglyoxal synthase